MGLQAIETHHSRTENPILAALARCLKHALERGSARAAFMLAETYGAGVLRSWGKESRRRANFIDERRQAALRMKERIETLK
jgi:hypothetical protein